MTEESYEVKLHNLKLLKEKNQDLISKMQAEINKLSQEITKANYEESDIRREIRAKKLEEERQTKLEEFRKMQESYAELQSQILAMEITEKFKANGAKTYQLDGASAAVAAQGFILAHSMGLGKTYQSILALRMISELTDEMKVTLTRRTLRNGLPPVMPGIDYGKQSLYICPKTLIPNVVREFKLWDPTRLVIALDTSNYLFVLSSVKMFDMPVTIVTNYEVWRRNKDISDKLGDFGFGTIVVDESHNLKNTETVNFKIVRQISRKIPFRILMTGTPILNRPDDIFTSLNIIAPAMFESKHSFNMMYCNQNYIGGRLQWVFQPGGVQALIRRTGNVIQKRTKEDVGIELPPITIEEHFIKPDKDAYYSQWEAYKEMRDYGITMLDDAESLTATVLIALLTRLRQICILPYAVKNHNGIRLKIEQSQKLDYVYELIDEITRHPENNPEGERTVLFSQFTEPLRFIKKELESKGYRVGLMIGETKENERDKIVKDLDAKIVSNGSSHYDIVLCNYKVGGIGLNFTDASQLILLDSEWNSGKQDQALARLHRVGQTKAVTVNKVLVDETVDKWMESLIEAKDEMLSGFNIGIDQIEKLKKLLKDES